MSDKPVKSDTDKLAGLVYFIIKWAFILWLTYWILWGVVAYSIINAAMHEARTPEGQEIINNNPYNHMHDGQIDPEWQRTHPTPADAPPVETPEPAMAPAAPASPGGNNE
jgi:hypothetical protein